MGKRIRLIRPITLLLIGIGMVTVSAAQQQKDRTFAGKYKIAYATYFGGTQWEQAREVIPYPDGTVLVGGMTSSSDLATTKGVVQARYAGDDPAKGHGGVGGGDAFLVRISADGKKILSCTYFGGSKQERGVYGMLLDATGNIVIGSATRSNDMPTTKGAYQRKYGGGEADTVAMALWPCWIRRQGESFMPHTWAAERMT